VARVMSFLPPSPCSRAAARGRVRGPITIERHHEHRALALGQRREAATEPLHVDRLWRLVVRRHEVDRERREDSVAPPAAAAAVDDHLPRGAEHERRDALGLAHGALAQLLEQHHEHVLHEVRGRGLVAQVLEPVEPDPRAEPPAELRLRAGVPTGRTPDDLPRERGVVIRVRSHARSIRGGALN